MRGIFWIGCSFSSRPSPDSPAAHCSPRPRRLWTFHWRSSPLYRCFKWTWKWRQKAENLYLCKILHLKRIKIISRHSHQSRVKVRFSACNGLQSNVCVAGIFDVWLFIIIIVNLHPTVSVVAGIFFLRFRYKQYIFISCEFHSCI